MELNPQQKSYLVLGVALFLCLTIIIWQFFLKRGTLTLISSAKPPYKVEIKGSKSVFCEDSPCISKHFPGKYAITIIKKDYFPVEKEIEIKLFKTSNYQIKFELIPQINFKKEYIPKIYPAKIKTNISDISIFSDPDLDPEKLPKDTSKIIFSSSGEKAIIIAKEKRYIYQKNQKTEYIRKLPQVNNLIWLPNETEIIYLYKKSNSPNQGVYSYNLVNNTEELVVFINQPILNYAIIPAPDNISLLLLNLDAKTIYLINKNIKNRKKISLNIKENIIKWSPDSQKILLNDQGKRLMIFNVENNKINYLSLSPTITQSLTNEKIIFLNQKTLIYTTKKNNDISINNNQIETIISFPEIADNKSDKENIFLYNLDNHISKNLSLNSDLKVKKLEIFNKNQISFLQENKIYEIILNKYTAP
ncbi:MAG: hypothetical protein UR27_C0002G0080 [Candidatus Peregrinibacteria bacterium GW2011_GWA2_33_10]|nr:MAG: hypothetical protein UR27_C0002G0080 [Candidatus Peregrinibacteria bacterium GW2011_GWA2_33_10]KKP41094.1 MAG: hypothetical protein UR30_C0002G0128 [Candidatus Peregrinibacteria bacterium GW2011_GWC2_33_13]